MPLKAPRMKAAAERRSIATDDTKCVTKVEKGGFELPEQAGGGPLWLQTVIQGLRELLLPRCLQDRAVLRNVV